MNIENPMCYRGYHFTNGELQWLREFKRDGAIPPRAHVKNYAISLDYELRAHLWRKTRTTISATYEREIAATLDSVANPNRR